ncbi:MAG: type IV pilus secretin PilQ [Candidatus Omnitrophica bacterium]|nr:type IV pilus secretin PilQ [Candidatus Omnitrophota bacterium]
MLRIFLAASFIIMMAFAGPVFSQESKQTVTPAAKEAVRPAVAATADAAPVVADTAKATADAAPAAVVEAAPALIQVDMNAEGNVSLDFRDADIKNVLKVLAYKSGVNIIAGPEVVGLVNIQLKNVPWKKALEVILATYGYSYDQKGTIITVTTVENLRKRREDAKSLADQEPLSTESFILNYSKASEVKDSIEKMKTARGSVNFDKRTNVLIVSDVETNLQMIREVVKGLDAITPQVLIEARIIETTLNKGENMGIDWNILASATGASRPTTFPFSTHSSNQFVSGADFPITSAKYANPFDKPGEFAFGTLNLSQFSVALQMLKTRSDVNTISNPRIVTLDNQPAKITAGSQYPLPKYIYNEQSASLQVSGWDYIDIGVTFLVTPHVNGAGMVTLDIEPTVTDILGYVTLESTTVPQLSSETAKTSVMIKDGDTLMIAGLIKDKKTDTRKKVPILGDIPFFGLPFQKKDSSVVKTELVIFMTPHIITPGIEKKADVK